MITGHYDDIGLEGSYTWHISVKLFDNMYFSLKISVFPAAIRSLYMEIKEIIVRPMVFKRGNFIFKC